MKILIFFTIINLIILKYHNKFATYINIFDDPNNVRKIHKSKVPLTGGLIFAFSFFIYLLFFYEKTNSLTLELNNQYFLLISFFFLLVGLIDDKINLNANLKFFIFIILISVNLIFDPNLNLDLIKVSFYEEFRIHNFSFIWTLVCFLLFINAFNMFDGINFQCGNFFLVIITFFIFKNIEITFFLILLTSLGLFAYLNLKTKCFLGNNGSYFISYLICYLCIKSYNLGFIQYADEIVILMIIPGLELIRLFFSRILKKRHPFSSDSEHIHHYLLNKLNYFNTFIIIQSLIIIPIVLSQITDQYILILLIQIITYIFLIFYLKKNNVRK